MADNHLQNDWMSKINDNTPLNQINPVGSYRSQYGLSPTDHLYRGFRFFDLRLNSDGSFLNFMQGITRCLEDHKTEFVIV